MPQKHTASSFIEKANQIFSNKYDYSLVDFVDLKTKIKIICPIHGIFDRVPSKHIIGRGCPSCGKEKGVINNTNTKEQFIEKANIIHNFKYDYSLVEYVNNRSVLKIICPKHGLFYQKAYNHLSKCGCTKCSYEKLAKERVNGIKKFIKNAHKIHKNKYSYELSKYISSHTKLNIICYDHGIFEQSPANHLAGKGCPKCGRINTIAYNSKNPGGWSISAWKKKGEKSKYFDSFKVYIIKCFNENEEFYKIGRTFTSIKRRFDSMKDLPYKWEVLKVFEGTAEEIHKLESNLKKKNKQYKYIPKIYFAGLQECYLNVTY